MKFVAYGMNHTTAPVEAREKYALGPDEAREILRKLKTYSSEVVFLPTCNRVEFYLATDHAEESLEEIRKSLFAFHRLKPSEVKKFFYRYEGVDAFLHLFRVSSSLDSMVVGEAQILGQVKEAYQSSLEWGMTGALLNGVFSRAFAAAKKVRTQTEIARMPVNVSSVAVVMAKKIFSSLSEHAVLLLGAGEMSELTAKYLVDSGVSGFYIANRTIEKAKALAAKLAGKAVTLEEGLGKLSEVDIVLASVGGDFRLTKAAVEKALRNREGRSLFIIDTGVPRNVDPEVGKLGSVYLYNIDDLASIADANREGRQRAVEAAEGILRSEVEDLCSWMDRLELVPTLVRLRERFEGVYGEEWSAFLKRNSGLPEKERRVLERFGRDLIAKLLHDPLVNLKGVENAKDRFEYARMLREIFSLEDKGEKK